MNSSNRPILEQALTTLIPTYIHKHAFSSNSDEIDTGSNLPTELISLAGSLLAHSRSKAASLKAEEEIARTYACAHLACERLKKKLNLPRIQARPPCAPRVYKKLYGYLDSVLLLHKERGEKIKGIGGGSNPVTPTKRKRNGKETEAQSSIGASGTPTRTPTTNTSATKGRPTSSKKDGSQMKAAHLQQQQQQQKQHNSFSDAIYGMSSKSRTVTLEPPDWTMPAIRRMCAALEIPKAAPHVYAGVRSVMAFEEAKRNDNGEDEKRRRAENGSGKLKGVRGRRTMSSGGRNLESTEDNISSIDTNGNSHSHGHRFNSPKPGDAAAAAASSSPPPIAMTDESGNPGNSGSSIEHNMMALMASLLFYTLARMRGVDTSPEDFIRQRDVAVSALLSGGATGSNHDTTTTTVSTNTTNGAHTGVIDIDDNTDDRRSTLLSQIERTMRAAQNGWLLLEWYQNIREGSYDTEWDEDDDDIVSGDDDDDDDENDDNHHVSYGRDDTRTGYSEQNPPRHLYYYTPQKGQGRGRSDMAGPGLGAVDGLVPMKMLRTSAQQQPVLCCTMMQYQVDYLSEERREDFVRWKARVMARVEEIEREREKEG